jgi:hypothetical protein
MSEDRKENANPEKTCCSSKKTFSTILKFILGLVFLVLGGWLIIKFWGELFVIIKGCIGLFLLLVGLVTLAIARE